MRKTATILAFALLAVLGFVATAQMGDDAMTAEGEAHLAVAGHDVLGDYLVDDHGRTLYVVVDGMGSPVACTGDCAEAWPPLTLESAEAMMGDDMSGGEMSMGGMATIDAELVGTLEREDGTTQITYAGHPLYYFVGDEEPGEVNCQAIAQFGGTWYVLSPSGEPITTQL